MGTALPPPPSVGHGVDVQDDRFRLLVESVVDYAILMLDPDGHVLSWNAGAERLKGYEAHEIIGTSFEVFYPAEAIQRGWPREELRRASTMGRMEDEGWRVRKDGSMFWASVVITALRDPQGRVTGFGKVTRDLTERRRHEEALRESEEQLRLLVGSVQDYAIFMLDPEGHVLTWNTGAERINGHRAADVIGHHFSLFFTSEDVAHQVPERELATALAAGRADALGWRVRRDGSLFWANGVITPVRGPGGELRGYAKVIRDLSDQQRLLALEQSSRRMEEFLAMLAHELRNPLAPLRNAVEIMTIKGGLPGYMAEVRGLIDRQTRQLTRLVDDLLDVARITTGKIALVAGRVDLRDVILSGVETVRPQVDAKQQVLTFDISTDELVTTGDAARLVQAVQNLLNNATRYTGERGEIRVSARREGQMLLATIADNGIGLSPGASERIFDLFWQEHATRDPSDSGLGIGLSLARRIIELHGGQLTAFSPGPGKGSSFSLALPLASPAQSDNGEGDAPPALAGRRVLITDDNVDSTDSMVTLLSLLGHDAHGVYSGTEALAKVDAVDPDVVLLDLNMPVMDGYAVAQALRARPGRQPVIIAMTGYGAPADRQATKDHGFDGHLTKPVDLTQLEQMLAGLPGARTDG